MDEIGAEEGGAFKTRVHSKHRHIFLSSSFKLFLLLTYKY